MEVCCVTTTVVMQAHLDTRGKQQGDQRMRRYLSLVIFLALLFPIPASALRVSGTTVLIPIIGRFAGANSTQWRTDVFISSHYSPGTTVNMTFYVVGGAPITKSVALTPFSSVALRDIV